MAKVDPRLRMLLDTVPPEQFDRAEAGPADVPLGERIGVQSSDSGPTLDVLLEGGPGLRDRLPTYVMALFPAVDRDTTVQAVRFPIARLPEVADHPAVARIEASRQMFADLNVSKPEIRAHMVSGTAGTVDGQGIVVAVIDSGIDYTHQSFRHSDGTSRILWLWDQAAPDDSDTLTPFGAEYSKRSLDEALRQADPHARVPHRDRDGHGTHVACIAAGSGGDGQPFGGVAPGAGLIAVSLASGPGQTLGRSAQLSAALEYVVRRAEERPLAINLSLGMNGGGHAGETLVERRIDELAARSGCVIVKSAGNERTWGIHAGGAIAANETRRLPLNVRARNHVDDIVEIWFFGNDHVAVSVRSPSGEESPSASTDELVRFDTVAGNHVRIDAETDADGSGDARVTVILQRGSADEIEMGEWQIILHPTDIEHGRFDAWIERAARGSGVEGEQSRFLEPDGTRTISIPGTARRVITVGSYVTKPRVLGTAGQLSTFSSHGPTRLGATKPDLAAPGEFVMSAKAHGGSFGPFVAMFGTSMAAPHVTGAAALLLEIRPQLTSDQVKQLLRRSARRGAEVEAAGAEGWGAGKIDVAAAVELARTAEFPVVTMLVDGSEVVIESDRSARAVLRLHRSQSQLHIGKAEAELHQDELLTSHVFDMSDLEPGKYHLEAEVTTESGWTTTAESRDVLMSTESQDGPMSTDEDPAQDDLTAIPGIGKTYALKLTDSGIRTFDALSRRSTHELARITGCSADRIERESWIARARALGRQSSRRSDPARHVFTLVAVADAESGALVTWEIHDSRTKDKTRQHEFNKLLPFLSEKLKLAAAD